MESEHRFCISLSVVNCAAGGGGEGAGAGSSARSWEPKGGGPGMDTLWAEPDRTRGVVAGGVGEWPLVAISLASKPYAARKSSSVSFSSFCENICSGEDDSKSFNSIFRERLKCE